MAREADAAAIAAMVRHVLLVSNAGDYPPEVIAKVAARFTADLMSRRIASGFVLVARRDGRIVGTGSLDTPFMRSLFVDPACQCRGLGSALCDAIEGEAARRGLPALDVQASLTARAFYERRDYKLVDEAVRDGETIVMMRKTIICVGRRLQETAKRLWLE